METIITVLAGYCSAGQVRHTDPAERSTSIAVISKNWPAHPRPATLPCAAIRLFSFSRIPRSLLRG